MIKRKFITVSGTRLAYAEANPAAAVMLFFIHGNSGSAQMWVKQLTSPLLSTYRLVALDLPAHGHSAPLAEAHYNLPCLAGLLTRAVQQLAGKAPYFLVGFSLGANLACETLAHGLQPKGIVLISPTIRGSAIPRQARQKKEQVATVFTRHGVANGVIRALFHKACLSSDARDREDLIRSYRQVQPPFRTALARAVQAGLLSDELALLQTYGRPLLLLFGQADNLIDPDYLDQANLPLWRGTLYKIKGSSHFVNIERPSIVNALLHHYLQDLESI